MTKREKYEAKKLRRRQVEQSYREYTPPQVRHGRFLARVLRVNKHPKDIPGTLPSVVCKHDGCGRWFNPKFLNRHVRRAHGPSSK